MKHLYLSIISILLLTGAAFAQTPQAINYQGIARGSDGNVLVNQNVSIRLSILSDSINGAAVYVESHAKTTDGFGLFSLQIGQGSGQSGAFSTIDWGSKTYYLKVEIDPAGGLNYILAGTSHFASVPYALHAITAENGFSGDYNDLSNLPALFDGEFSSLTGTPTSVGGYGITNAMTTAHPANNITSSNIAKWNTAFSWGNHAGLYRPVSYVPSWSQITSNPFQFTSVVNNQLLKYNSASGKWENWTPNFLTSFSETDPVWIAASNNYYTKANLQGNGTAQLHFNNLTNKPTTVSGYGITDAMTSAHPANTISSTNISNWSDAYSWGNHAGLYRPISYVPAWSEITSNPFQFNSVSNNQLLRYNSISGKWENWTPDFQESFNEIDPVFGAWDKSTGIVISSSQVNDFNESVTNNPAMLANTAKNSYPIADANKLAGIADGAEVNVNADWNATNGDAQIFNKPMLSTVAITGNYNDLINKPAGAAVGDMLYWDGSQWTRVPVGNSGQALVLNGSIPAWGQSLVNVPIVITNSVTNISSTSASCGGNCSDGGSPITARGVCWSNSENPTVSDSKTSDGSGSGTFSSNLNSLSGNTAYHVRAYATNSLGTSYGNDVAFSTTLINTTAVSNIQTQTATSGGSISGDGGYVITAKGVCWNTMTAPTINNNKTTDGTGIATFTSSLTNLTGNTTYYVRAYYTNSLGTFYGNEVTFVTSPVLPVVTTGDTLNVTRTTIQIVSSNVTNDGGSTVIARGICWGTTTNPTISGSKTIDGSGLGLYTSSIAGLTQYTTYYVRAYATNNSGTSYGSNITFITKGIQATLSTDDVQGITTTSGIAYGTITASGSSSVTERGFCWRANLANPTITNSKLTSGSGVGSYTGTLTFLTPSTTYHIRAYAITAQGTSYGADFTFTTLPSYYEGFESGMPAGWNGMWSLSTANHYDGFYSLYSIHLDDTISFTRTIITPEGGQISFRYLGAEYICNFGSSHLDAGTNTQFYIDNVYQTTCNNMTWSVITFPISPGTHTFKWVNMGRPYANYCWGGGVDGEAWIDYFICPN